MSNFEYINIVQVSQTQISLAIVSLFIVCHGVRWVPNTWELSQLDTTEHTEPPEWLEEISALSHLLITLSCSVNWSVQTLAENNLTPYFNSIDRYIYVIKQSRRNSEVETTYLTHTCIPLSNIAEV